MTDDFRKPREENRGEWLIFVYGTLRKMLNGGAGWNYSHYLAPLEPVAVVEVPGYYLTYWGERRNRDDRDRTIPERARREYEPGFGIPVMCPKLGGSVTGEVYRVDAARLKRIDYLEGVGDTGIGGVYRRVEIQVAVNGKASTALTYVAV